VTAGLRYLVTGPRDFSNWSTVRRFCAMLPPGSTVIHGDARGLDSMVHRVLTQNPPRRARAIRVYGETGTVGTRTGGRRGGDIDIEVYPADWDRHRRPEGDERRNPAGAIRNRRMLQQGNPDRCVYFGEYGATPGTTNMVDQAQRAGVETFEAADWIRMMREGETDE
jgi:hypothetical protein